MNFIKTSSRLDSLDMLRGLDLFLLVFFQPVLMSFGQQTDFPWMTSILYQFEHEVWVGFRFGSGDATVPIHDRSFHAVLLCQVQGHFRQECGLP